MMSTASVFQDSALSEYMKNSLEASHDSLIESLKLCLEEELGVTSVGRTFRMIQKIGQGSFGEVFKTVSLRTGMFVALKRIRIEPETRGFPKTSLREMLLLTKLQHANIVRLNKVFCNFGNYNQQFPTGIYLAFDFCHNDLCSLLRRFKFPDEANKNIALQILHGIDYLHWNDIIHRDLKPTNILVTSRGIVKIADFGWARWIATSDKPQPYTPNTVTLQYRPPELLLHQKEYGKAVDMWSYGCILAELWFSAPLIWGKTETEQLLQTINICGSITAETWPEALDFKFFKLTLLPMNAPRRLREILALFVTDMNGVDLIDELLVLRPDDRLTVLKAREHIYFRMRPRIAQDFGRFLDDLYESNFLHYLDGKRYQVPRTTIQRRFGYEGTDVLSQIF